MTKKEIKDIEKKVMWVWLQKKLPEMFNEDDETDDIGKEITVGMGSYKGTMSWLFEHDGSELLFVIENDGAFSVTISEVCHERKTIWLINPEDDVDIEELQTDVNALCTIFTNGNAHVFMDFIQNDVNIRDLRMSINAYIDFENTHPDIIRNITYISF